MDKTSQKLKNIEESLAGLRFEHSGKLDLVPIQWRLSESWIDSVDTVSSGKLKELYTSDEQQTENYVFTLSQLDFLGATNRVNPRTQATIKLR